ncbi:dihydrofolate reductase family protein [Knoellia aerolata]|uniref:Deaminase n=1 Tax=Knoellia aerolata DSM 18566 TaxID=1385519 RepID=A0A0A0JU04_9MICO|nr:dihydrofolate reductase family protein [Knoellia aerolata]KGN40623.1 deaminase [Knoellia aerolata DSM 18566]
MATIYYTGCTLDGFIATPEHSLDWLMSRDIDGDGPMGYDTFSPRIGACAMGASTWRWLLDHDPQGWSPKPTWVFTHRDFPASEQVRFTTADVAEAHAQMVETAGDKDVWLIGGGDLVGQFHDAGLLDEVWVQYAPVTIGAGAPVLPRHVELRLEEVARNRDFMCGRYSVVR